MVFDCGVSDKGKTQIETAIAHVRKLPTLDVILVSPLSRTIETCLGVFRERIASSKTTVQVCPLARERVSGSDDLGRPSELLKRDFPMLDFSVLQQNVWWYSEGHDDEPQNWQASHAAYRKRQWVEPDKVFEPRIQSLKAYLCERPEKTIAVVSHWDTLVELIGVGVDNAAIVRTTLNTKQKIFKVHGKVL